MSFGSKTDMTRTNYEDLPEILGSGACVHEIVEVTPWESARSTGDEGGKSSAPLGLMKVNRTHLQSHAFLDFLFNDFGHNSIDTRGEIFGECLEHILNQACDFACTVFLFENLVTQRFLQGGHLFQMATSKPTYESTNIG